MDRLVWLLASPIIFVLPGLWPARTVTGGKWTSGTFAWALFFSAVLLPPIAFGLAMLLGTTVNARLLIPLALIMGAPGFFLPKSA